MSIEVGSPAPDFCLKTKTAEGIKEMRLSDNFGKKNTVLLFVPLAFTPVCTREFCTTTEDYEEYSNLDAEVWGISIDSPFTLDAWAKASGMNTTLLSDMKKEAIEAYGVLDTELMDLGGVAHRSIFIVNKEGKISYKWLAPEPQQYPDFEEVKAQLDKEMAVEAH